MPTRRVVQWSTGGVGSIAVAAIAARPDFDLVGVRVHERPLEVAAGLIEAGTVGAVRFETIGVVDGRDAIVIEHVNRMALSALDLPLTLPLDAFGGSTP